MRERRPHMPSHAVALEVEIPDGEEDSLRTDRPKRLLFLLARPPRHAPDPDGALQRARLLRLRRDAPAHDAESEPSRNEPCETEARAFRHHIGLYRCRAPG